MIANKKELLQAAQKLAADNIATTDDLTLTKAITAAYDALGFKTGAHFQEFSSQVHNARSQYITAEAVKFAPEA